MSASMAWRLLWFILLAQHHKNMASYATKVRHQFIPRVNVMREGELDKLSHSLIANPLSLKDTHTQRSGHKMNGCKTDTKVAWQMTQVGKKEGLGMPFLAKCMEERMLGILIKMTRATPIATHIPQGFLLRAQTLTHEPCSLSYVPRANQGGPELYCFKNTASAGLYSKRFKKTALVRSTTGTLPWTTHWSRQQRQRHQILSRNSQRAFSSRTAKQRCLLPASGIATVSIVTWSQVRRTLHFHV
mmetsp:Transcript_7649/g.20370  ORF Transcript_7649/g.20370 Transcript_7649/m.20370 type:complete len:244 (+) Transcript_7649:66-797(+)